MCRIQEMIAQVLLRWIFTTTLKSNRIFLVNQSFKEIILSEHITFNLICISYFDVPGWWFDACGPSNLNGIYYQQGQNSNRFNGIKWYYWKGYGYSLKTTTMMIRPADFSGSLWTVALVHSTKLEAKCVWKTATDTQTKLKILKGARANVFTPWWKVCAFIRVIIWLEWLLAKRFAKHAAPWQRKKALDVKNINTERNLAS